MERKKRGNTQNFHSAEADAKDDKIDRRSTMEEYFEPVDDYERPQFPLQRKAVACRDKSIDIIEKGASFRSIEDDETWLDLDNLFAGVPRCNRKTLKKKYLQQLYNTSLQELEVKLADVEVGEISLQCDGYDSGSGRKIVSMVVITSFLCLYRHWYISL